MIGSKISVEVADAKGNKDVSDETAPVAVYEALEILDAEQKGAKTIEATFSEAITGLDELTVSKNGEELKQAYAPKIADDGLSATITLENRITAGTYTVTLTPADADEDPSSATFEGEVAALNSIEFVTDKLIMKDNEYKEGYAYIKGVDQFGDNMSLSSVTVIPGYGHFRSYDATTGKITIGVDDDETNFAIVKEVPVFVTYQNGADTIPANATLKVTTMSYVQDLTFGDIYKADGSKVDDDTNPLMIGDLKSKPYVEILDVEDQYGNKLSAKDLNDQANGNTKVLFVIPDESTTSAYYSTGKFSTITEKDGTVKTILYLAAGGDMPGSMDLIITGASGQSFSKPITVKDDPYIDVLRVNYPTLYEGTDESDALEFTAVDQYGKEIKDLFNFAPEVVNNGDTLQFNDANHLTGQVTRITAPAGVNWVVKKDNLKKNFTVSIKLDKEVKKGTTLVMMATTAGLNVTPTNLTVGQRTNGESIDTTIGSLKLDPQNQSFNFNKNVKFLSSNGTVMDRVENEQYPVFLKATTNDGTATVTDAENTYAEVMGTVTDEKPAFFWTVSRGAEGKVTHTGNTNTKESFTIEPTANANQFDGDGVIEVTELTPADTTKISVDGITDLDGNYKEYKPTTYYVTLYKASKNGTDYNVSVIDKQSFKLTYSPTVVKGAWQLGTQYTAELSKNRNIYADADKTDNTVKIRVKAYPNVGEPYYVADDFIQVTGNTSTIKCDPDTLIVTATAAGSATFSVYVREPGDTKGVYTTLKVTADKTQTATKPWKEFAVKAVAGNDVKSKVGADFEDPSRTATEWTTDSAAEPVTNQTITSVVTIKDGQMEITHANRLGETLTLGIKDQHDLPMKDAKFYVDGLPYEEFWEGLSDGTDAEVGVDHKETTQGVVNKRIIEVRSADDTVIAHYTIELGKTEWHYKKAKTKTSQTVLTEASLNEAIKNKVDEITIGKDITLTNPGDALSIPDGSKVIVPANVLLKDSGNGITLGKKSTLEIAGELSTTGNVTLKDGATITVNGTWMHETGNITGAGLDKSEINGTGHVNFKQDKVAGATLNVGGSTLVLEDVTFTGAVALGGHVKVDGTLTTTAATGSVLLDGLRLELTATGGISDPSTLKVAPESKVTIVNGAGNTTEVKNDKATPVSLNDDASGVLKDSAIDNAVKLWADLAKLTKAKDTTETDLQGAESALTALNLNADGEKAFDEELAKLVTGSAPKTVEATRTHVNKLLEEAAIKALGTLTATPDVASASDTEITYTVTGDAEGTPDLTTAVTAAKMASIEATAGMVKLTDLTYGTLSSATEGTFSAGDEISVKITTDLGNEITFTVKAPDAKAKSLSKSNTEVTDPTDLTATTGTAPAISLTEAAYVFDQYGDLMEEAGTIAEELTVTDTQVEANAALKISASYDANGSLVLTWSDTPTSSTTSTVTVLGRTFTIQTT